jgi:hypothetical protein
MYHRKTVKMESISRRGTFMRRCLCCAAMVMVSFSFSFAGSYPGVNPTMRQIDSAWRALYGSPVHQGIVVYNKSVGGNIRCDRPGGDASLDTLCIMRLVSSGGTASIRQLMRYPQWVGVSGWGPSSCYRISLDGSKIAMQNGTAVSVCDTNGANVRVIATTALNVDQLAVSWDDSATGIGTTIRRLVYCFGATAATAVIRRTVVNTDNSAGLIDTLWSAAWNVDPAGTRTGWSGKYTSVNKVGHYMVFDMPANVNIPVVVNFRAGATYPRGQSVAPSNLADGCQARMCQDTFGTVSYHESTHLTHTTLWRRTTWPAGAVLGYVPCPGGAQTGCTDCGTNMFYWCDSDTNYTVHTGDNDQANSPGCYTKAFIRRGKTTSANMMFLGDYFSFPALWIDPNPLTGTINESATPRPSTRISIKLTGSELTLGNIEGRALDNARLITIKGMVVARGEKTAANQQRFSVASLPRGIYLLSWQESNVAMARFVTIAR